MSLHFRNSAATALTTSSSSPPDPTTHKLKLLCLHGFNQNKTDFKSSLDALQKSVLSFCEFVFVEADVEPSGLAAMFAGENKKGKCWYSVAPANAGQGWMSSTEQLMDYIEQEDIDGVLGFSQGASMVALLIAEQQQRQRQEGANQPTFQFACCLSGFIPSQEQMQSRVLKAGRAAHPSVLALWHCFAVDDVIIPKEKSEQLMQCFSSVHSVAVAPQHTGGHSIANLSLAVIQSFHRFMYKQQPQQRQQQSQQQSQQQPQQQPQQQSQQPQQPFFTPRQRSAIASEARSCAGTCVNCTALQHFNTPSKVFFSEHAQKLHAS